MLFIPITKEEILTRYEPVSATAHKGTQGHALLIAGSYGKIGAAVLAVKAAIKTGCGLVTAFVPECGYEILQIAIPEAIVITDVEHKYLSDVKYEQKPQAIGIGPGIGQEKTTQKALYDFLLSNTTPLVLDADGLNCIALNTEWLHLLPSKTIVTPHPKELERLIGFWETEVEKFEKIIAFSKKYNLIVLMKGAPTHIIDGSSIYKNTTGNAALATAGSGDVLTGMITSLLAQSYEPIDAAVLAVYLHGLTADIAVPETGIQSFIASDIISNIGGAFVTIDNYSSK